MKSSVQALLNLAAHQNPRFINDDEDPPAIELKHSLFQAAPFSDIHALSLALGALAPELVELYSVSNGMLLFSNIKDSGEAFYFLPTNEQETEKNGLYDWLSIGCDDPDYEYGESEEGGELELFGIPPWWESCIVFAGWGYAPERLFVPTEGKYAGEIFQFEHDGGYSVRIAKNMEELFLKIANDPVKFIRRYYSVAYYDISAYKADAP